FGLRDYLVGDGLRDHHHAVAVPDNEISGVDTHFSDGDGHVIVQQPPAANDVLRRLVARKDREAELENIFDVADSAVDDRALSTARFGGFGRQFSEMRHRGIVRLADDYVAGADRAQHFQKRQKVVVSRMPGGAFSQDGERESHNSLAGLYRLNAGGQNLVSESHL